MAYFKKQEILDYVSEKVQEIEFKGINPLNPEAEIIKKLNDEEDMVGFFWIDYQESENQGNKINFEGKAFYRIDYDMYTDDRFAIDLYQAMKMGINVGDVIRMREQEKELAKQGIVDINSVEERVKNNTNQNGTE